MNPADNLSDDFLNDPATANPAGPPSRRQFLQRLGGGIIVCFVLSDSELFAGEARGRGGRGALPADFNAFLRIGEDGRVTCFTGKIEMGQGAITALPQMLAEDLEVPLESVDMVMGDTDLCPWDGGTNGSRAVRSFGPAFRAAAAEAKGVLLELAAEALTVPAAQLTARDGAVFETRNPARRVTYAQLTKGKKIERHLTVKPTLKDVAQFKVIGRPQLHKDARAKVTGQAKYTGDYRLPGLLYAKVLRPPAHGAKLTSVDTSAAKAVKGVQVVEDGEFVAVLHELPDVAEEALGRIKAAFAPSPLKADDRTIFEHLLGAAGQPNVAASGGDLAEGRRLATRKVAATYLNSYVAHAPMETHTALAQFENGKLTAWSSTQSPFGTKDELARALGLAPENVRVLVPFVGGGFGGKSRSPQAVEAARLARATGRPVQVMWSREEEFFYDTFRPAAIVKVDAGVDAAGRITYWDYDVAFAGERGSPHFYDIPHHRTAARGAARGRDAHPFGTGAWRAPGNNTNSFARECHIDALAAAAGADPVEFRLRNLTDPRMIRVLKTAAERFGWKPASSPSRRGLGVACGTDVGSCVATIAEVAVDPATGRVQVKRVVCAQDMGIVVNPQGATIQMEGCIQMGLGYALTEEIRFQGGKILDTNFDTYALPRFSWAPKIETVIVKNDELAPQGGGEPAIIVMGAVLANAVFDATGARLLQLPMTPARIKAALASRT